MTCRILVVGELLEHRDFAARLLETGGYDVVFISDPVDAIERMQQSLYDLILIGENDLVAAERRAVAIRQAARPGTVESVSPPLTTVRLIELVEQHAKRAEADAEIASLAEGYLAARARDIASLKTLYARHDYDAIGGMAHRIKGTGRSYGFPELTDWATQMESAARAGDGHAVHALLTTFEDTVARLSATHPQTPHKE